MILPYAACGLQAGKTRRAAESRGMMKRGLNFVYMLMALVALLAACTSGGGSGSATIAPTMPPANEGPALSQVTSVAANPTQALATEAGATTGESSTDEPYPPPPPAATTEGAYPSVPQATMPPSAYPGAATPIITGPPITPSPQQNKLIEAAARDLNALTDVPVDEIKLISAAAATWPNGGLGCPEEGMSYVDRVIEGMLVTLEAGGKAFAYHTDGATQFVLCDNGKRISSGVVP